MKTAVTGAAIMLSVLMAASCSKEKTGTENTLKLITPEVSARITEQVSDDQPFTGILEIYPCNYGSSTYYGNYINGSLMVLGGYYTIVKGDVFGGNNREIHLPIGEYTMVYWGTPKHEEPIDNKPAIIEPGIRTGADLSELYFSLRPYGDGTFKPSYDLVHAVQDAVIGEGRLSAPLFRVTAGMQVNLRQEDGSAFSDDVTDVKVRIGNIAEKINFFTAEAENMTKKVRFDLVKSKDGTLMSNPTVMLFPSSESPTLEILITLADGTVHTLTQTLTSALTANTLLTLDITIGKILPEGNPGGFTIEDWNEANETIEFPTIE